MLCLRRWGRLSNDTNQNSYQLLRRQRPNQRLLQLLAFQKIFSLPLGDLESPRYQHHLRLLALIKFTVYALERRTPRALSGYALKAAINSCLFNLFHLAILRSRARGLSSLVVIFAYLSVIGSVSSFGASFASGSA